MDLERIGFLSTKGGLIILTQKIVFQIGLRQAKDLKPCWHSEAQVNLMEPSWKFLAVAGRLSR